MVNEPSVADLAAFLGTTSTDGLAPHLNLAHVYVRAYTRGVGFDYSGPVNMVLEDLYHVILAAAARSYTNPTHATREEIGSWNTVPGKLEGFTLAEQFVLNEYRRRTA